MAASEGEGDDARREECYALTPALRRLTARPSTDRGFSSPLMSTWRLSAVEAGEWLQ